jgi:hypothetical protein
MVRHCANFIVRSICFENEHWVFHCNLALDCDLRFAFTARREWRLGVMRTSAILRLLERWQREGFEFFCLRLRGLLGWLLCPDLINKLFLPYSIPAFV